MMSDFQRAFVLHSRPYRETSLLLDLMTESTGMVSAICKGAKRGKNNTNGLLQPFSPLMIQLKGKHDLAVIASVELTQVPYKLLSKNLIVGFYLNELLLKLLHKHEPHPQIFERYTQTLNVLATLGDVEPSLRMFEFNLLSEIGYGFDFTMDAETHQPILKNDTYYLILDHGFVKASQLIEQTTEKLVSSGSKSYNLSGKSLLDIDISDYSDPQTRRDAKFIARATIDSLLGSNKLKTRQVII